MAHITQRSVTDYSKEALEMTTRLLKENPEYYTVWNYRRHILERGIFPDMCAFFVL